jgi:hypothetical protein
MLLTDRRRNRIWRRLQQVSYEIAMRRADFSNGLGDKREMQHVFALTYEHGDLSGVRSLRRRAAFKQYRR